MNKRGIAVFLIMALCVSLLPVTAFAESEGNTDVSSAEESVEPIVTEGGEAPAAGSDEPESEIPAELTPGEEPFGKESEEPGGGEEERFALSVNPYGHSESDIDTVHWYCADEQYYLFLPSDCDLSALTVYFNTDDTVSVGDTELISGEPCSVFENGGVYGLAVGETEYVLNVLCSANIPAMYIETESGSLDAIHADKNNKESADIRIYADGELQLDTALKQIKGRGNSTWECKKKPYNIKFDKKTSVLDMPKAKKWTLLANYFDPSAIRNPLAWYLAKRLGLHFSPGGKLVDLYINGEYMGNYTVCESVEIGENRVNIHDLASETEDLNGGDLEVFRQGGTAEGGRPALGEIPSSARWVDIPSDPEDITGGYLLETELSFRYNTEISGFVTSRGQAVVVKEPEYASEAQVRYIASYWQEAEDAIRSPDGCNSLGKHYSEYFDVDSLVNMYILLEFSVNNDAGATSSYFYKDRGGKLVASPVWDYDQSFGGPSYRMGLDLRDPSIWYARYLNYNSLYGKERDDEQPTVYNALAARDDFNELVKKRWNEIGDIFTDADTLGFIDGFARVSFASALMNGIRWKDFSSEEEFLESIGITRSFVINRKAYLDKGFGENSVFLYYDVNGGSGWMHEMIIHAAGETATVHDLSFDTAHVKAPSPLHSFAGWSTRKDGRGVLYQPGDGIVLNGDTTLYAQWKTVENVSAASDAAMQKFSGAIRESFRASAAETILNSIRNVLREFLQIRFHI